MTTKTLDPESLTWYMQEIQMHGFGCNRDFSAATKHLGNDETRQTRFVWFHLFGILSHSAMISKYLDPIGKLSPLQKDRRDQLRHLLNVGSTSAVLARDARDNVEHFDERIDNWVGTATSILEIVVPDRKGYEYIGKGNKNIKRLLIADEMVFVSERRDGTRFELPLEPLYKETQRIAKAAEDWIDANSPYHFVYPT